LHYVVNAGSPAQTQNKATAILFDRRALLSSIASEHVTAHGTFEFAQDLFLCVHICPNRYKCFPALGTRYEQ
jgi:hypothetical protein